MTNPITKYLQNLFAKKRVLGDNVQLRGVVKADALLNDLVNEKQVPGLAITVLKDGKKLLQKGYGYADIASKTPINPAATIFRIASVSKNIAAAALAQMVSEGLIDLDASYYDYVPYFPKKKYDFTIRHLASHTAGIRAYRGTEYGLNKAYTIKESIEIFAADALLFEPGTDYLYNSYDWVLISLAMQEVSGIPFEEYVQDKVLAPLNMNSTFAPTPRVKSSLSTAIVLTEKIATCYSKNRLGFRKAMSVNNYFKLAGGGYLSTSEDIANLGQALLADKLFPYGLKTQFLSAQTVNGQSTYYGLGWQVSVDKKRRPFYGHVGNGVGAYSNFFVFPEQQIVFSILTNCTNPHIQEALDEVRACFFDQHI